MYQGKTIFRSLRWTYTVLLSSVLLLLIQINGYSQKGSPKVNIDQGDNGQKTSPKSPVEWVNGNLNTTKTHYIEGQSIPYRITLDNIPIGVPITVRIGFDLRNSGHFAIDYLTSDTFSSKHAVFFKHPPEKVLPELGIPAPIVVTQYAPMPDPGNFNAPSGWADQPQASFNVVKAAGNANMSLKNAVFQSNPAWVSGKSPNFSESNASYEVEMDVTIVASALPVIIGFGGHIASRFDWGYLPNGQARSAGGISGAPYHMRVIHLDYDGSITSIGNQDRSLQVAAPDCNNLALLITNQQNILCNGTGSGAVLLSTSGGTPGFQYSIDSGKTYQFSNLFSELAPGNYLFTVRDTIGCTNTVSSIITEPPALSKSGIVSNILCFGAENGAIDLSVSGGTPGYTYSWSNGAVTQDLSALSAGTYSVLITDVNNCTVRDTFQINQPASAILASGTVSDVLCYGANTGSINLNVSGGTPSYAFEWLTGETSQNLNELQAGIYSVLITDANGCIKRDTFTIKQPDAALAIAFKSTDVLCYGDSTGSIDATVTSGTPPYSFEWSNGETNEDISNLKVGTYVLTVTDANNCIVKDSVIVQQPDLPLLIQHQKTNVLCYDEKSGSIDVTVTGGSVSYTYNWSNGATTPDIADLAAGIYTLLVTDGSGCIKRDTIEITQPATAISSSGIVTDILCHEVHSGAIDLTVNGGTPGYTYQWFTGETSQDLSGLQADVYSVLITDANGCTHRDSFTISQPAAALDMTFSNVDVLCFGDSTGTVNMTVSGGTAPYSYLWSNGATTEDLPNVKAGIYEVLVTDDNGCFKKDTVQIDQPQSPIAILYKKLDVLCYGQNTGEIDITVSGGSPDYTFSWSNGTTNEDVVDLVAGVYTVIVSDISGCIKRDTIEITEPASAMISSGNITDVLCYGGKTGAINLSVNGGTPSYSYKWLTGETSQNLSGLQSGVYSVLITDANGCTKRDTFTIKQPNAALAVAFKHVDVLCYGDSTASIDMTVTDGTIPYSFVWSTGAVTEDLSHLKAGTYVVVVTDDNGCVVKDSVEIDQPLLPLSLEYQKVDVLCYSLNTGSIDLSVLGGSPEYQYAWSNGATSQDLFNLTSGIYSVIVTDASGCIKKDTLEIIQPKAGLSVNASIKDLDCNGIATGGIDLTVEGATPGYSYSWSNGATTEDLSNIAAGIYIVTVTDSNLCFKKDTFEVKQPEARLSLTFKKGDVLCHDDSTGSIDLSVNGGTKPYHYSWSNGATTEDLSNVQAGVYVVSVTDDKGCNITDSVEVVQPQSVLAVNSNISDILCKGDSTGSIDLTVSGGTPSYQFSWSSGEDTEDLSGKTAGMYSVLITDANNCILRDTFEIKEPAEKLSVSGSATDLKCYKDSSGSIDITVSGGTVSYTYSWSNGTHNEDLTGIAAGTYTVTVTDKNGCSVNETFVVNQPDPVMMNADDKKVCTGVSINLTASPTGGVWSGNGVSASTFMMGTAGMYQVYYTYTNGNGCIGKDTAYITVERCGQTFCTYTQGYYGNPGGKSCAEGMTYTTKGLMQKALSKGSIVLGIPALNRTFTMNYNSVDTVIALLPGGGPATMLAYSGNRTPSTLPVSMLKKGRINNVLLSQTITLAFNIRINSELDSFKIRSDMYLMTQDKVSCAGSALKECSYHSYKFSTKIVNALTGNKTISDLMKLANNALAGSLPAGLSYSDVAGAVDLVNNAFDECKLGWYSDTVVYCPSLTFGSSASNMTAMEQPVQISVDTASKQPTVKAFPNPFEELVRFTLESPERIQCNLTLYTSSGKLISKVFDGVLDANVSMSVQSMIPSIYKGAIVYVLAYKGQTVSGTIFRK